MQRTWAVALFSLGVSTVLTEGASLKAHVIPAEVLEAPQKFEKDLKIDDRPQVGSLHFGHPYPTIQDSEDFDKDFVKDENADNGEYTAQSEYDRLRHKVTLLTQQAKAAGERKNEEKKDLEKDHENYKNQMAKDEKAIADKLKEKDELLKPFKLRPMPVKPVEDSAVDAIKAMSPLGKKKEEPSWWPFSSWGKPDSKPQVVSEDSEKTGAASQKAVWDFGPAEKAIEQAAKNLKDCEKELADAEADLKKLKAQLEAAEKKLALAHDKVKQSSERQLELERAEKTAHHQITVTASDELTADKAYQAQKALIEKLQAQLMKAAEKVRAMRAAEDKDGGVYPVATPEPKSGANSIVLSSAVALAMATIAVA